MEIPFNIPHCTWFYLLPSSTDLCFPCLSGPGQLLSQLPCRPSFMRVWSMSPCNHTEVEKLLQEYLRSNGTKKSISSGYSMCVTRASNLEHHLADLSTVRWRRIPCVFIKYGSGYRCWDPPFTCTPSFVMYVCWGSSGDQAGAPLVLSIPDLNQSSLWLFSTKSEPEELLPLPGIATCWHT